MGTSARLSAISLTGRVWAVALGLVFLAAPVAAQPALDCGSLLSAAQEYYTNQRFEIAERAVHDCLARPEMSDADALQAYRLLALLHLRQSDLAEAEQAVTRLLSVSFEYTPDPVLDPPSYVALVGTVRNHLPMPTAAPPPAPVVETTEEERVDAPISMPSPSPHVIQFGVSLGAGSYSGERGINGGSLADEFRLNGGFSFALDGSYAFGRTLAAVASYRAARFPLLLTNDVRTEDVHVRPEDSSAWVHVLSLMARAHIETGTPSQPYVQAGVSGFFSHLNSEMRVGVGPQLGLGLDVPVTPEIVGFAELNLAVSLPGDAVDRVSSAGSSDLLTFMGAGLRYRITIR